MATGSQENWVWNWNCLSVEEKEKKNVCYNLWRLMSGLPIILHCTAGWQKLLERESGSYQKCRASVKVKSTSLRYFVAFFVNLRYIVWFRWYHIEQLHSLHYPICMIDLKQHQQIDLQTKTALCSHNCKKTIILAQKFANMCSPTNATPPSIAVHN